MSRPTTLPPAWAALAARAGGVAALARALGVGVSTVRAWGAGTRVPTPIAREAVSGWARRRGLPEPWSEPRAPR